MRKNIILCALIYFAAVSFLGICMTIFDKLAAKRHKQRISENTLLATGAFGAAAAMFVTMKIIRHKTRHKKFMIGLPLIVLAQVAAIALIFAIRNL